MLSYNKLWHLLIDKGMKKADLRKHGVHSVSLARMSRNERVSLEVLEKICDFLDCDIGDIVSYTPNSTTSE
jgi:DNA-binding Xre family transcriptional regulator